MNTNKLLVLNEIKAAFEKAPCEWWDWNTDFTREIWKIMMEVGTDKRAELISKRGQENE